MKTAWLTAATSCQAPTRISGSPTSCTQRGISTFRGLSGAIAAIVPSARDHGAKLRANRPQSSPLTAAVGYPGSVIAPRQRQRRRRRTARRRRDPRRLRLLVGLAVAVVAVIVLGTLLHSGSGRS